MLQPPVLDCTPELPATTSWWLNTSNFYANAAAYAKDAKVAGDSGLPPALATYLHHKELCEAREMAEIAPPTK
jgi:hypothetical protein